MKLFKKIIKIFLSVLLVVIIAAVGTIGFYYPHYRSNKEIVEIKPQSDGITVMSSNLRCLTPLDIGKKSWFYRADLIVDSISRQAPGVIGFQEATKWQYEYLVDSLKGYDSVITYRDDSVIAEGCPVFYNTELYSLVDKGSFWLSETPEEMSKDWGSACYRICSYVILTDLATNKDFVVFNVHLDHISDEARIKGVGVILDKISQFGSLPSVIMGDFNAVEGSETYIKVTENFLDAKYETDDPDMTCTYQNWGQKEEILDYFMVSKSGINVNSYEVIDELSGSDYISDHFPIVLKFDLA